MPYANFGLFISLVQFFGYFLPKFWAIYFISAIFWLFFAQGKYLWNVLKNRSNEIHTNEIRIRREPSVCHMIQLNEGRMQTVN